MGCGMGWPWVALPDPHTALSLSLPPQQKVEVEQLKVKPGRPLTNYHPEQRD